MRLIRACAVTVAVATGASVHAADSVRLAAVVIDRQGRAVPGLAAKDFEVRDDGVVQKIESVEPRRQGPRRFAILLDEFHVNAADAERVRDAVDGFVRTQLRAEDTLVVLKPLDPLPSIRLSDDVEGARRAIASFDGRNGVYEPRTPMEEETMGRAPALVEAGRAQVVLSALRALTAQLGAAPGRSAILLVSNGFAAQPRRFDTRGLPGVAVVDRLANRYDVPIYAFDPRLDPAAEAPETRALNTLAAQTGGTLVRGSGLAAGLVRAATDLDSGYTITYTPPHGDDGRFHPVQIALARNRAASMDARARAGYISSLPPELRGAGRTSAGGGPSLPTRMLHRSPLIAVWSGVMRMNGASARVAVTWEPGRGGARPARVGLKATTRDGLLLYEGILEPVRLGETANEVMPDRAEFEAPAGRVQLDMTVLGIRGERLDVDARDFDVPVLKGAVPVLLPPVVIPTQSAREFRGVAADVNAAPAPSPEYRRTERLLIRVPAYAMDGPVRVAARLLNRIGQPMREIPAMPESPDGVTQFDLSLAPLASGDYFLLFSAPGPSGTVEQRLSFKVGG